MLRRTLLCAVLLAGCQKKPTEATVNFKRVVPAGTESGAWVARFGHDSITEAELAHRFAEMNPYARARFQTVEQRRDYVEGLARFELLSQEAIRQGLANDPEVIETARRVMVQTLLKKELEERADALSDAQIREYYQQHVSDYVKPAMTRLSHLAFSVDHREKAEKLLKEVKALPPLEQAAFGKLAREASEDEKTRVLDGDLRFLSDEELTQQFGAEFARAAATLQKVGDVSEQLVEGRGQLHIIKLQGRQLALNLSVEQAKPSIQQVLLNDTKQERFRALLERLKKQANFEVNESALASMVVDPKAPALESKGPTPGYLPAPSAPMTK